jgi:hypothetical protein
MTARSTVVAVLAVLGLAGCAQTGHTAAAHPAAVAGDPSTDKAVMDRLASLAGEWEMVGEDGQTPSGNTVFAVSSAGSVLREVMMPGQPHEMTNLYHMDGSRIVCTHYCAAGNQPRMVATGLGTDEQGRPVIDFAFDSVSNLRDSHDHYMGGLRLTFVDANTLHQDWTSFNRNGETDHSMTFVLKRRL